MKTTHYKTIVISDVHLGTSGSRAKELVRFLKRNTSDLILLNGDIVDGWRLKKGGIWKKKHTRFIRIILKMIQKFDTRVIYLRGNHDDFLDNIIPLEIGNFSIQKDYIYESNGRKYFVAHGDIFDSITTNLTWLARLGDIGYTFLLWLNKIYNYRRQLKGLPYFSLSQTIKNKVKSAVSYINSFEKELTDFAKHKKCDGIICGHIHHPAIKMYDSILYLNSGDWVETLSVLAEDFEGNWHILYYTDMIKEEENEKKYSEIN